MSSLFLPDENATAALAQRFSCFIQPPLVITLQGEIGAGKTTFVRALLKALHYVGSVKSPTFSIVESYLLPEFSLVFHHFDLYRINDEELDLIGFRDYFTPDAICCIEWPERAGALLSYVDMIFNFSLKDEGRLLELSAKSTRGEKVFNQLQITM